MRGSGLTRVYIVPPQKQERWRPRRQGWAVRGPKGGWKCGQWDWWGHLGDMARAQCSHPDVHVAHSLLYKLCAKSAPLAWAETELTILLLSHHANSNANFIYARLVQRGCFSFLIRLQENQIIRMKVVTVLGLYRSLLGDLEVSERNGAQ